MPSIFISYWKSCKWWKILRNQSVKCWLRNPWKLDKGEEFFFTRFARAKLLFFQGWRGDCVYYVLAMGSRIDVQFADDPFPFLRWWKWKTNGRLDRNFHVLFRICGFACVLFLSGCKVQTSLGPAFNSCRFVDGFDSKIWIKRKSQSLVIHSRNLGASRQKEISWEIAYDIYFQEINTTLI